MISNDIRNIISDLGLITQIGLMVVICLGIGLVLGLMADKWVVPGPIFKIIGIILGMSTGIWQAYRMLSRRLQ